MMSLPSLNADSIRAIEFTFVDSRHSAPKPRPFDGASLYAWPSLGRREHTNFLTATDRSKQIAKEIAIDARLCHRDKGQPRQCAAQVRIVIDPPGRMLGCVVGVTKIERTE